MINAAALFSYLNFLTVDVDAFLRSLEIDLETVRSSEPYIPIELCLLIQDEAANFVDDPFLGLLMGEFAGAGSWSILGCTMMNCNTLGEDYTVEQITCLPGFSEPDSSCKAFKKWSGVTPRQYQGSSYATAKRVVS